MSEGDFRLTTLKLFWFRGPLSIAEFYAVLHGISAHASSPSCFLPFHFGTRQPVQSTPLNANGNNATKIDILAAGQRNAVDLLFAPRLRMIQRQMNKRIA